MVFTSNTADSLKYKLRVALRDGQEDEDRWRTDRSFQFFSTFGFRNNESTNGEPCKLRVFNNIFERSFILFKMLFKQNIYDMCLSFISSVSVFLSLD